MTALAPTSIADTTITTTSTFTTTIIGYNIPDLNHILKGFFPIVIPLMFGEIIAGVMLYLGRGGDFFVTLYLFGVSVGSTFGSMAGQIPFAMTVLAWALLAIWLWMGGQGSGGEDISLRLPRGF